MGSAEPRTPAELLGVAGRLLALGRVEEAIVAYRRLLEIRPGLPDSWYNLGYLLQRARRFDEALEAYAQALCRGVSAPWEVCLNRATVLAQHLARPQEAEAELLQALRWNPAYVPALVNLGNIHEQSGRREEALTAYEAALAIEPASALALSRLANLVPSGPALDALIERLRTALARPGIGPVDRADLAFGLGKALDEMGRFAEAFQAYSVANQSSRSAAGAAGAYDRLAHERFIDRLIETFDRPASASGPFEHAPAIFICGMFRSGSTLAEQILAGHPRVTAGGEIDLLPIIAEEALASLRQPEGLPLRPSDDALQAMRSRYRAGVAARHPIVDILTDKRPDNFLYVGLIKEMFPGALILHTRRNPLDNCLSVYFTHLGRSMAYASDLDDIAHWYGQYVRLMQHWKALYPTTLHDVDYDHLVVEPRAVMAEMLRFCGLSWDDACLSFHRTQSIVATPSAWQVRQPLYRRASGRWRNYESHLRGVRSALADVSHPFGAAGGSG